jgi:hypothetical protein
LTLTMKKLVGLVRSARWLIGSALVAGLLATGGLLSAQPLPPDIPPIDPTQFKSQMSQTLVRLVMNRPISLAQQAAAVAVESGQLALDIGERLKAGQGPNGGPPTPGLETEASQLAASAAGCAQQAKLNAIEAGKDLEKLKAALGGQLESEGEPGPDGSVRIVQWLGTFADVQRERNAVIDQCLQQSYLGLGRLQAYRSMLAG